MMGQSLSSWKVKLSAVSLGGILLSSLSFLCFSCSRPFEPRIALFCEDYFPYPNANKTLRARDLAAKFEKWGLKVQLLDSRGLASSRILNTRRYPILINIYGDAFPAEALKNLIRYHRRGGCFISNGVPFGLVCKRKDGRWEWQYPPEEESNRHHNRLGAGNYGTIEKVERILYESENDLLGLGELPYELMRAGFVHYLDLQSLAPEDVVKGIVRIEDDKGNSGYAVAVIEHQCKRFRGAVDIWAGAQLFSEPVLPKIISQIEIFLRSAVYLAKQKHLLSEEEARAILDRARDDLAEYPLPELLPRPDRYVPPIPILPKGESPAENMVVVDLRPPEDLNEDERTVLRETQVAVLSLQGLVNRVKPRIYILWNQYDESWLENIRDRGYGAKNIETLTPDEIIRRFIGEVKGVVVPPDNLYCGLHIAIVVAACENLVIMSEKMAKDFDLPLEVDLRRRWQKGAEAYHWAFEKYFPRMSHQLAAFISPERIPQIDYFIACKIFPFFITGPWEQGDLSTDSIAEVVFANRILGALPVNIPIIGFGYGGRYRGIGESESVELYSRYGKFNMVGTSIPNLSVHSGISVDKLAQQRRPKPKLNPSKHYLTFVLSDGDNLAFWHRRFPKLWRSDDRGHFPMGWSMGPTLIELSPDIAEYYYDTATPNDQFICALSGVAYTYPEVYGMAYIEEARPAIFNGFLELTRLHMERLDMRTLHIHHHGPYGLTSLNTLERYGQGLEQLEGIFLGYGRHWDRTDYSQLLDCGIPLFYAMTGGGFEFMVEEIRKLVPSEPPSFLFVFVLPWHLTLSELENVVKELGSEFEVVTPEELSALYSEWRTGRHPPKADRP